MEKHIVKILNTNFVTHNVKHFVVEKPRGFTFESGQATDVSINKPGQEEEMRPFTFTSPNNWENLEFTIKLYTDHDGVTNKLLNINAGDELILHDVYGSIAYKNAGLFIAAGAGITPFISILRHLKLQNLLSGNALLFANHTEADIILKEELMDMLGDNLINVIKKPTDSSLSPQTIDKKLLSQYVNARYNTYYICGPDEFTTAMINDLRALGIEKARLVYEH